MKRFGGRPVDKKIFTCPQCKKLRMSRVMDHKVSTEQKEFKTRDGSTVSLFVDVCDPCIARNYRKYFEPTRSDIRKVLKAMNEEAATVDDVSLEELL
jgi:hypothetical protein